MLEHAGEVLMLVVGFWRFAFSGAYRQRKLKEWRELSDSLGGRLAVGSEVVAGIAIGLGLPVALILGSWALVVGI
jgi:hypothetical protein